MTTTSDQESHSIASFLSSSYTLAPFSPIESQLKQAEREANGDTSTDMLLERAQRRLIVFEQDTDRMLPRPSDLHIFKDHKVDHYKLIKVILERAPNEYGRRYVAALVCVCDDTNTLVELSNIWIRYVLIPLASNYGGADIPPSRAPSDNSLSSTDSDQDIVHDYEFGTENLGPLMVKLVRLRDGYQCPITEIHHLGLRAAPPPYKKQTPLVVNYILKRAIGVFDPAEDKGSLATWEILRRYAGWDEKRTQEVIENLDTPLNGILIRYPYDFTWDHFVWTLKPALNCDGTIIPNTYDIEVIIQEAFPGVWTPKEDGSINTRIAFKDRGTESIVQKYMPEVDAEFLGQPRLMPDPELIALHRALSWVFYTSGVGNAIDSGFSDLRVRLPSKKIRNTDETIEKLSWNRFKRSRA